MPLNLSGSLTITGSLLLDKAQGEILIGEQAGVGMINPSYTVNIGYNAGHDFFSFGNLEGAGVYIGGSAGLNGGGQSVLVGYSAGANNAFIGNSSNMRYSTMVGNYAGNEAIAAKNSTMVGWSAGYESVSASYSVLIGYLAGKNTGGTINSSINRNNIIIGSNLSLESGRQDSINIGGLIFGTGSYYNASDVISSGSANGKIGVNQPLPQYSLDVSGSIGLTDLFVLATKATLPTVNVPSGSIMASGSNADFKPYFWNGSTWTSLI